MSGVRFDQTTERIYAISTGKEEKTEMMSNAVKKNLPNKRDHELQFKRKFN